MFSAIIQEIGVDLQCYGMCVVAVSQSSGMLVGTAQQYAMGRLALDQRSVNQAALRTRCGQQWGNGPNKMAMMQWGNEPRFSNGGVDTRDLGPIKSEAMALRGITKTRCQWARREEDQQKGGYKPKFK